jgi:hypothetical protein
MSSRLLFFLLLFGLVLGLVAARDLLTLNAAAEASPAATCSESKNLTPAVRREILRAREAVWRAWFANDREKLDRMIPAETVAINAGAEEWEGRDEVLAGSRAFVEGGGRLVRLEFPRTEIQLFGDVAILYTTYRFETDTNGDPRQRRGERSVTAGRGTEIFVRRGGRWVNSGWHTDSGR